MGSGAEEERERELVGRAAARDATAFRELVDRHRDRAYALALRMLRSPEDAMEVAQDAFVRAWLALPRFRGESKFGTWLHRIVVRRALDRAATLKRRRGHETVLAPEHDVHDLAAADPAASSRMQRIQRLIDALPETPQKVVTLFYLEGRSVEQVAELLRIPSGTVKTHLFRARALLRAGWEREEPR